MIDLLLENFESVALVLSILVVISIFLSKYSFKFGIPSLLFFLGMGMLAGTDGIGKIYFDDHLISKTIGMVALIYILFSGGLDTNLSEIKPVLIDGLILSNFSSIITGALLGVFVHFYLDFNYYEAFLLGAIVCSTDAASVFGILRTSGIGLKGKLKPLLEFESGSNDTAAVILTTGILGLISTPSMSISSLIGDIFLQVIIGALSGYGFGRLLHLIINKINLDQEGLYTVFTIVFIYLVYAVTNKIHGNGFLAVYICGIIFGNSHFIHKRTIIMFADGVAWLMQILMFLTLGLLVYPTKLLPIVFPGIIVALFLIFIARPLSIFICLPTFKYNFKEKLFISWVGLRGAAPIILATIPYAYDLEKSDYIFNIVFFIVLISLLLQGSTIKIIANFLKLSISQKKMSLYPFEYQNRADSKTRLVEVIIPYVSHVAGKSVVDLKIPEDVLITLICRGDEYLIPNGKIILQGGDVLLVLVNSEESEMNFNQLLFKPKIDS
jgi:potassium/hydrogen antiporter